MWHLSTLGTTFVATLAEFCRPCQLQDACYRVWRGRLPRFKKVHSELHEHEPVVGRETMVGGSVGGLPDWLLLFGAVPFC